MGGGSVSSLGYTRSTSMDRESSSVLEWLRLRRGEYLLSESGREILAVGENRSEVVGGWGSSGGEGGGGGYEVTKAKNSEICLVPCVAGSHPAGAAAGQCPAGFTSPQRSFHLHLCIDSHR